MNKIIGYLVSLIGFVLIAFIVKPLKDVAAVKSLISLFGAFGNIVFVAVGAVLIVVGVMLLRSSGGKKLKEVPIYQGKDIVGFRRFGKK